MINNTSNLERLAYISNPNPNIQIEKPFSKTHALSFGIGVLEKL